MLSSIRILEISINLYHSLWLKKETLFCLTDCLGALNFCKVAFSSKEKTSFWNQFLHSSFSYTIFWGNAINYIWRFFFLSTRNSLQSPSYIHEDQQRTQIFIFGSSITDNSTTLSQISQNVNYFAMKETTRPTGHFFFFLRSIYLFEREREWAHARKGAWEGAGGWERGRRTPRWAECRAQVGLDLSISCPRSSIVLLSEQTGRWKIEDCRLVSLVTVHSRISRSPPRSPNAYEQAKHINS